MSQTSDHDTVCPNCGLGVAQSHSQIAEAQKQIEELQAQVKLLTEKATAAVTTISPVDKWADYEDEIQRLKKAQSQQNLEIVNERTGSPSRFSYLPVQNRFSSLLSRKSTPNLQAPPTPGAPSTTELVAALTSEQTLRKDAERKLSEASGELEELTAHLFMQANEMVATERKARAKLEERVELLERRDGEKRKRLERLEGAVQRIERVRGLLAPGR
ncbi:ribosomal L32 protein [Rutstroemia sp. NJR-2017a BBW]|nr:ribosomal L32 protein [Rutstroemia sp. NJR-2017a BBW]